MDRCSDSERRPNLDHHISNPSPHFDPAAGVFLRRPTVPRRLGRKTSRCPRCWRGGPDRHFSVGRRPGLLAGSPAPPRSRTAAVFPGRSFCLLHAFGHSPHTARPGCACGSDDRRDGRSSALRPVPLPLLCFSFASLGRRRPRLIRDAVPASSADAWPAAPRAYPPSAPTALPQVQSPQRAPFAPPPPAPMGKRRIRV